MCKQYKPWVECFVVGLAAMTAIAVPAQAAPNPLADAQRSLDALDKALALAEKNCYYNVQGAQKAPLDHAQKLRAEVTALRQVIEKPATATAAQQAAETVNRQALVAWNWLTLTQLPKQTVPPALADTAKVSLRSGIQEREPGGFYLTNLTAAPMVVEVRAGDGMPTLLVRWVTTHETSASPIPPGFIGKKRRDYEGPNPHLLARIVPLIDDKYLVLPAFESRQVFVEVNTTGYKPGRYETTLTLSTHPASVIRPGSINKSLFPFLPEQVGARPVAADSGGVEDLLRPPPPPAPKEAIVPVPRLTKTVKIELTLDPLVVPLKAPFGVYSWNQGASADPAYLRLLVAHKINLFAVGDSLPFTVQGGQLTIDPDRRKETLNDVKVIAKFGKMISLYGIVQHVTKTLKTQCRVDFMKGDYAKLLEQYFLQYIAIFKEAGIDYEDFTLETWDEPTDMQTFQMIRQALDLLHRLDPKVRFMVDPQCKLQEGYELIAPHIWMWIPHNGMVYDCYTDRPLLDMVAAGFDPAKWGRNNNKAIQMFCHRQRQEKGAYCMMYSQYGGNAGLCPVGYFRHWPWKMWWMRFDGITFWNAWAITNSPVLAYSNYNKGLTGYREGVKDIQRLYMLHDAIGAMQKSGAPAKEIAAARAVLEDVERIVPKLDWWCVKPVEAERDMNAARVRVGEELMRLHRAGLVLQETSP